MSEPVFDAIIVGGGMAGLTAAAFLARDGRSVLVCEKEAACGGLVSSFERDGFVFDSGIRALEDSGILFPMLKKLGIDIDFVRSSVSLGVEGTVIRLPETGSVETYEQFLADLFPESLSDIRAIVADIREIMKHMEVLYGIDNPMFLDAKEDRAYLVRRVMPWALRYLFTAPKIARLQRPVEEYLKERTENAVLRDMISQHFFRRTPTFFAMSYISLYLDYHYPAGGTGRVVEGLVEFAREHGVTIRQASEIVAMDPAARTVSDRAGAVHRYRELIWAADTNRLYSATNTKAIRDGRVQRGVSETMSSLKGKRGGDSVVILYLAVDLPPSYFASISTGHFFYTPRKTGLSSLSPSSPAMTDRELKQWIEAYFALTSYEISIPVLRDPSLAPAGQTGLVISTLFDYDIARIAEERGWYREFKDTCTALTIRNLAETIYPGLQAKVLHSQCATPVSLKRIAGTTDGAITGWAFTNDTVPAESKMTRIGMAVSTPFPHVSQAGQWTFTPAGFPIAILTGKVAADRVSKALKRDRS